MYYIVTERMKTGCQYSDCLFLIQSETPKEVVKAWCSRHMIDKQTEEAVEEFEYAGVLPEYDTLEGAFKCLEKIQEVPDEHLDVLLKYLPVIR